MASQDVPGSSQPSKIGPYRVEALLERGGMGEVYRGYDDRLDRPVALKCIHAEGASNAVRRKRFRREARSLAKLSHSAIVQIYDWVETDDGDWIVMELVEGRTLRNLLNGTPLPVETVVDIARDILGGLALAHGAGIIHRDLKAENVMITAQGRAKLLDFGLAKRVDSLASEASLSADGKLIGTVSSMSPEQALGREVDERSDVFSLGTLLYEMVTGLSPFRGESPVETLTRICTLRQIPASQRNLDVPDALSQLIDDLLQKDPARRPQSAAQLEADFEVWATSFRSGTSSSAFAVVRLTDGSSSEETVGWTESLEAAPSPTKLGSTETVTAGRTARGRGFWLLLSIVSILAVAIGLWHVGTRVPEQRLVAVAQPQIRTSGDVLDATLLESSVQVALVRSMLARRGISAMSAEKVQPASSPTELARSLAADEVITSQLDCQPLNCRIRLDLLSSEDGKVLWSKTFDAPADDLLTFSSVIEQHLRRAHEGYPLHANLPELRVSDADYADYLRLRRAWYYDRESRFLDVFLTDLEAIRRTSPFFPEVYLLEATVARDRYADSRREEDLERVFSLLGQARQLAPDDPRPLAQLAVAAGDVGQTEKMTEAIEALAQLEPGHPELLKLQGMLLRLQGDARGALRAMRRAARRQPSRTNLFALAQSEYQLGEWTAARESLLQLLERFPDHSRSRSLLAQIELIHGSQQRAAELYEELLEESARLADLANLGLAYLLLERYSDAVSAFQQTVEREPGNAFLLLNLADARKLLGDHDGAEQDYRQVLVLLERETDERNWQAWTVRAQALAHLGQIRPAVAAVQEALRLSPDHPQTLYEVSLAYTLSGEETSALVAAEKALEMGVEVRWFELSWFDSLRGNSDFEERLAKARASD